MQKLSALGHTVFYSVFKTLVGDTFSTYLMQLRIINCHKIMVKTNFTLAYIAVFCGFCNQSHMERTYKRLAGVLPSQAREHSKKILATEKNLL